MNTVKQENLDLNETITAEHPVLVQDQYAVGTELVVLNAKKKKLRVAIVEWLGEGKVKLEYKDWALTTDAKTANLRVVEVVSVPHTPEGAIETKHEDVVLELTKNSAVSDLGLSNTGLGATFRPVDFGVKAPTPKRGFFGRIIDRVFGKSN